MKRYSVIVLLLIIAVSSMAIPAKKNVSREVKLADGRKVQAELKGDDVYHWWETADGMVLSFDDEGNATVVSSFEHASNRKAASAKRARQNQRRSARAKGLAPYKAGYYGQKKGLVILVNFKNLAMKSATVQQDFDNQFNQKGYSLDNHIGSVHDYYYDQSYGQLDLTFDVIGPVTVSQYYAYYGQNDANGDDKHPAVMVAEACELADSQVDFSDYDWDGDGEVDQVFVIYAGYGENSGASSKTIWPHEFSLSAAAAYGDGKGAITLDKTKVNTYAVSQELTGTSGSQINGIGTACHEFSHCLGLMDTYDTDYGDNGWGMQGWDLMSSGSYNGPNYSGEVPCGYTAYQRWVAGWLEPKELTVGMNVSGMKSLLTDPDAYILYNDNNKNEYYMLENHQADRWFKYVDLFKAPSGMMITHIDYDISAWENNVINADKNHQRFTMFLANNKSGTFGTDGYMVSQSDYSGHLYPYNGNDSLTNTSVPAAMLYNANSDGKKFMNKGIVNIKINDDGTISFGCVNSSSSTGGGSGDTPTNNGDNIFYESFDGCEGKGGNDGLWSGSIASATFKSDVEGWTGTTAMYGANKCARFGSGSVVGQVTSPSFTLNGEAVLTFKASAWNSLNDGSTLDVYLGGKLLGMYDIPAGSWNDISIDISGNGATSLSFVPDQRFFLDEVKVTAKVADAIRDVISAASTSDRIFTITGQYVGNDINALPVGVYIYKGRKTIKR